MQTKNKIQNILGPKKSQISVFILIAVLIILLFIFLIFLKSDDKKGNLEDSKNAVILEDNQKLSILKSAVDSCLEIELKKALIVSGLRGGFIYNKGEYYFPGTIPPNTYTQTLISNLGLNWNNLQSRTLVHSEAQVYTPGIDKNVFMFQHSITDDIEKYISKDFVDCLNFADTEGIFEINFTDYLGKVVSIDYDNHILEIDSLHAVEGDIIDVDLPRESITGRVDRYLEATNSFRVQFDNVSFLGNLTVEEMANLDVININRSLNLTVNINNEDVSANLNFPVKVKSNNFETTFEESTVTAPVRYKSLLDLSKELLSYKYLHNKSIEYMEPENVLRALNNSKYFQTTNFRNLSLSKKILIDEKEHKRFIFSLIDKDSRILGKPFVLSFAYENIAPTIEFGMVDPDLVISDNGQVVTLLATEGDVIHYNLRNFTFEKQYWDDYILYYEPVNEPEFNLSEAGDIYFKAPRQKVYRFNIHVTDGETTREHIIEFITGFPDNVGNRAADECFQFSNFEGISRTFPITSSYKNKYFEYDDGTQYTMFGLVNYVPTSVMTHFEPGYLYFSKSCVFDTSKFEISVTSIAPNGIVTSIPADDYTTAKYRIEIPNSPYRQEISVEVRSINSGTVMTEPFRFVAVPARCLGPTAADTSLQLTCCNTDRVNQSVNNAVSSMNVESINLVTPSNLNSGNVIYDKDIYMCYNPKRDDIFNFNGFDYEAERIWDIDARITSLFQATMRLVCQGDYPMPEHNVEQIGSGVADIIGQVVAIKNAGIRTDLNPSASLRMRIVRSAGQCEICEISNFTSFGIIADVLGNQGLVFRVGEVDSNSDTSSPYVGPIPGNLSAGWYDLDASEQASYDNLFMLCDHQWQKTDGISGWQNIVPTGSTVGSENYRQDIYVSKSYCYQDSDSICKGRVNSPLSVGANDATDASSNCRNYYLVYDSDDGDYNSDSDPNTGWDCAGQYATGCNSHPACLTVPYTFSSNTCNTGLCSHPATPLPTCTCP